MTKGRHCGRPAPLRWGGSIALAGTALALAGGYLQLGDRAGATTPEPTSSPVMYDESPPPAPKRVTPTTTRPSPAATSQPPAARPGKPVRLSIPRLQVAAGVLGISTQQGELIPPSNPRKVGWWNDGAFPGARRGSAVITGHTVHAGGGAFDNLEKLRPGDVVGVTTAKGQLGYRVTSVTTYRKQALAKNAARIFDQAVPGRLVLITCEDWTGKVYLSNVVVIAQRTS
ncbi:class F sortase [Kribbella sp. NPDC056345]|uniref:class F sortase n=1 Tax=Kribbella sp. NPDC056345 TaxID=3345789 RepID=UPI0035DA98C8